MILACLTCGLAAATLTAEELVAAADALDLTAGVEQLSFASDAELPAALEALDEPHLP